MWPGDLEGAVVTLTGQQLNWLLDGYDIRQMTPHKALKYKTLFIVLSVGYAVISGRFPVGFPHACQDRICR